MFLTLTKCTVFFGVMLFFFTFSQAKRVSRYGPEVETKMKEEDKLPDTPWSDYFMLFCSFAFCFFLAVFGIIYCVSAEVRDWISRNNPCKCRSSRANGVHNNFSLQNEAIK